VVKGNHCVKIPGWGPKSTAGAGWGGDVRLVEKGLKGRKEACRGWKGARKGGK